jgi:hypothetical protein
MLAGMDARATAQRLVLFYAATAAACREGAPPKVGPDAPLATAAPTVAIEATTAAVPSTEADPLPPIPVASAAMPAPSGSVPVGGQCRSDGDCKPGLFCQRSFTGAGFTNEPGHCVKEPPVYEGRPLTVGEHAHVAHATRGSGWSTPGSRDVDGVDRAERVMLAERMRDAGLEEHASIAAFARTICELLALGAPAALVARTNAALADEIHHAQESFAWAEALGGAACAPGSLSAAVAPFDADRGDHGALLRDVFRGGCIGETLAVERALQRSLSSPTDGLREFYAKLADDEARHAALAFDTVDWLVTTHGELRTVLDEEIARLKGSLAHATVAPLFDQLVPDARGRDTMS